MVRCSRRASPRSSATARSTRSRSSSSCSTTYFARHRERLRFSCATSHGGPPLVGSTTKETFVRTTYFAFLIPAFAACADTGGGDDATCTGGKCDGVDQSCSDK